MAQGMDADELRLQRSLESLERLAPRSDVIVRPPLPLEEGRGSDLSRAIAPCYTDGMAR